MNSVPARGAATRLLVLQATQFCNIDCTYCYVPNRTRTDHINPEVLAAVRGQILEQGRLVRGGLVLWHAGEPLAIGLSRFVKLRESLFGDSRPLWVREQIQTNGMLINEEWAGYLHAMAIMVGVSVDGPEWLHDKRRQTRTGAGTHQAAMNGISVLRKAGVDFSIICVVGQDALDCPAEIFQFLKGLGPKVIGFTIEKIDGGNLQSSLNSASHFDRVRKFFNTVYRTNALSESPIIIREVEQVLGGIAVATPERSYSDEITLGRIISISLEGNVGFFSPEMITNPVHPVYGDYTFGNLLTDRFATIEERAFSSRLMTDILAGAVHCKAGCDFWRFCYGGSPSAKIGETGTAGSTETSFCVLSKHAATLGILDAIVETPPRAADGGNREGIASFHEGT